MKKIITSLMTMGMLLGFNSVHAEYDCMPCSPWETQCGLEGFYVGAFGGANFLTFDAKLPNFDGTSSRLKSKTGYVGAVALGYRWNNNLRTELEYSYRYTEFKKHDLLRSKNDSHINAFMVNAIWDISLGQDWLLKPFVGAGIGYACQVAEWRFKPMNPDFIVKRRWTSHDFAWQILTGVTYPVLNNVDVSLEYRFFKGNQYRFNHDYNHSVGAGLRYYF